MRTTALKPRPDWAIVLPAAILCGTVTAIHVLDQGGVTQDAGGPWWIGWGYRALEAGGVLTALLLLSRRLWALAWTAALSVGLGPFVMYLLTRGVGLTGDMGDKGAWNDPLGTVSLMVEAALILAAVGTLFTVSRRRRRAAVAATMTTSPVATGTNRETTREPELIGAGR